MAIDAKNSQEIEFKEKIEISLNIKRVYNQTTMLRSQSKWHRLNTLPECSHNQSMIAVFLFVIVNIVNYIDRFILAG